MSHAKETSKAGVDLSADPNYYRLIYHRAAQRVNEGIDIQNTDESKTDEQRSRELIGKGASYARRALDDVVAERERLAARQALARQWHFLRLKQLKRHEVRLEHFLRDTVEPCLHLLIAGALVLLGESRESDAELQLVDRLMEEGQPSYRVYYNRACYACSRSGVASASHHPKPREGARDWSERALRDLGMALERARGRRRNELARWAEKDPALQPLRERPFATRFRALIATYVPKDSQDRKAGT